MFRKKPLPSFRECVESRYQFDLVMNGIATLLVLLVPLAVMGLVDVLGGTDGKYSVLADFWPKTVLICLCIEAFLLMIVIYRLFARLINHSRRDRVWMSVLVDYAERKGCPTEKLRAAMRDVRSSEPFLTKYMARLLLGAMFFYILWVMLFAVPVVNDLSGDNELIEISFGGMTVISADVVKVALVIGSVLVAMMIFTVLIPVMRFPAAHEARQVLFTRHLVNSLNRAHIIILPMVQVTKKMRFLANMILLPITYFLWTPFMLFKIFRNMNNHLLNEWEYEAALLKVIESDGDTVFSSQLYDSSPDRLRDGKEHRHQRKRFAKRMRRMVRLVNRKPAILFMAELFLIVLCANYILKMIALTAMMSQNIADYTFTLETLKDLPFQSLVNIAIVAMDLLFLVLTIDSVLGIASRRASSWRKVVRSCVTFVIPLWISAFITKPDALSHIFDFNVYATTIVLIAVMTIMLASSAIRRYYTPVGYDMPPMRSWIRYAVWGSLVPAAYTSAAFADDDTINPPEL